MGQHIGETSDPGGGIASGKDAAHLRVLDQFARTADVGNRSGQSGGHRLNNDIASYTAKAALSAGLPVSSLHAFVEALASSDTAALSKIPGVTPTIIALGVAALKQAFADALRVVYIIAAPFGALACIACLFLGDLRETMNYRVDAPIEDLHAKPHHHHGPPAD